MKLLDSIKGFLTRIVSRFKRKEIPQREKPMPVPDSTRRIRLILETTAIWHNNPPVRVVKVDDFYDVLHFMLRLCDAKDIHYRIVGSLLRCNVMLPDKQGTLILREKNADAPNKIIAVLKVKIPLMEPPIEKVVFQLKQDL